MKKENKLFLNTIIIFLFIAFVILIIRGPKLIQDESLKGNLFTLIDEDDGGWGEWGNEDGEEELLGLEGTINENIENISLDENLDNITENQDINNNLEKHLNETKKKSGYKQDYEGSFLGKKTKISVGGADYEFTIGFYISIFLIVLVLGIISFWVYSFLKKRN